MHYSILRSTCQHACLRACLIASIEAAGFLAPAAAQTYPYPWPETPAATDTGKVATPAKASPWSATLYAGVSSDRRISDIFSGQTDVRGGMIGLAVDRDLFSFGWDISGAAEAQLTEYTFGSGFTTMALGLGLRFHHFPWNSTSLAIYSGPSYSLSPPHIPLYYRSANYRQKRWLNFIGIEFAVASPWDPEHWDGVLRIYHRSGVWGVYSLNIDEGTTIGFGIRAKF